MDIRNYFAPANKKISTCKNSIKKKRTIESDEEDPLPSKSRKQTVIAISDSDDDLFEGPSKKKKSPEICKKTVSKAKHVESQKIVPKSAAKEKKLVETSAIDFFGSSPVIHKRKATKRKSNDSSNDIQSDEAFARTLQQLEEEKSNKMIKVEEPIQTSTKSNTSILPNGLKKKGLASKLSEKIKKENDEGRLNKKLRESTEEDDFQSHKSKKSADSKSTVTDIGEKPAVEVNLKVSEKSKISPLKRKSPIKMEEEKRTDVKSPAKKNGNKKQKVGLSPFKMNVDLKAKKGNLSLKMEVDKTATPSKDSAVKKEKLVTPVDELKRQRSQSYLKYLNRSGPRNPGSKPLPEGSPGCLAGLTFVITGVPESMDKTETEELIKKFGGKVTGSVSRKTSYLIIGDDPGVSKTKKADELGTKTLDEDSLFKLIENLSSKSSTVSKSEGSSDKGEDQKASSKVSKFHESVQEKKSTEEVYSISSESPSSSSPSCKGSFSRLSSPSYSSSSSMPCSQSTEPISSQDLEARPVDTLMWVDKYKPASMKNIVGQQGEQSNARKLCNWLKNWFSNQNGSKKLVKPSPWSKDNTGAFFKASLLSGPPGVGKTTTAHLVCKELEFDVVEMNASDTRSKKALGQVVTELLTNQSLSGFASSRGNSDKSISRKHVLLMDEVDGMAGNEDRGGVQELISLIKSSKVPVICMCNDRNHPKIRSLANYCFDLKFSKPRIEQIRGAMMSVCFREGLKIKSEALDQMILGTNQDIRQVLHHLSMYAADKKLLDTELVKKEASMSHKDFKMGPWDVCTKVFSESAHKDMSIHDKVSLFFHDYSIGPLFVQENYLKVNPHSCRGDSNKRLMQIAKTALSIADSDIIDKAIRSGSAWSLLPTQALFSSVCPGEYMEGHFSAQVEFPKWLGNNSRKNKFDRLSQELHTHMRLRISGNKNDIITGYCSRLRDAIVEPLFKMGVDGVKDSVEAMTSNDLIREDLDSILELSTWSSLTKDKMVNVESKVKAAFTRTLNKASYMSPFSNATMTSKKSSGNVASVDEYGNEEEDEDPEEEEEDDDITKNSMIKQGKLTQKKESSTKKGGPSKGKGKREKTKK